MWWLQWPTLGIYFIVWYYKVHAELADFDPRQRISPVWEVVSVTILGWFLVLYIMSIAGLARKIRAAQRAAGLPVKCSGGLGVLLMFCFGAGMTYYQRKLNAIIDHYGVPAGEPVALQALQPGLPR